MDRFGFINKKTLDLILNHYGLIDTYSKTLENFWRVSNVLITTAGGAVDDTAQNHLYNFKEESKVQINLIKKSGDLVEPELSKERNKILSMWYYFLKEDLK